MCTLAMLIGIFGLFCLINELYTRKIMSKKDLKDYIGKSYTIKCNSKDEWNKIINLHKSITGETFRIDYEDSEYGLLLISSPKTLSYWATTNEVSVKKQGYCILPASDFLEEDKSSNSLEIEELVKGNYYYIKWDNNNEYIFKREKPGGGDSSINITDSYIAVGSGDFKDKRKWKEIRLASIEEIKWLDKCIKVNKFISKEEALKSDKPQFEVGKWYEGSCTGKDKPYYVKFKEFRNGYYYCDYIVKNNSYSKGGAFNYLYEEVSPSIPEIQKYLPEGHPDKIVEKKELSRDELLEKAKRDYPVGTKAKSIYNNLFEITSTDKINYGTGIVSNFIFYDNGEYEMYNPKTGEWCKIISKPETKTEVMEEFKVGDWVVWKNSLDGTAYKLIYLDIKTGAFEVDHKHGKYRHSNIYTICRKALPHEIPTTSSTISNSSELTSLPKKWFVKIPRYDEKDPYCLAIEAFRKPTGYGPKWYSEGYLDYSGIHQGSSKPNSTLTEISEEQFKRDVLNYSPKQATDDVPEYYECIDDSGSYHNFKKGRIYKCVNPNNLEAVENFIDDKGIRDGWSGQNYKHFKPSTKEAYDAQNYKSETKTIKNEEMEYIWLRLTNTELLEADRTNTSYHVSWKIRKSDKGNSSVMPLMAYRNNGDRVISHTSIDTRKMIVCSEEEASTYFKELIDTPKSSNKEPLTKEESYWIPKVGDWCYILNRGTSSLLNNKVYRINDIKSSNNSFHFDIDGKNYKNNSCWVSKSGFRKAEPHEIPTTTVGNNYSTSSEITWEELLRSDGKWVNFDIDGKIITEPGMIIVDSSRIYIVSNQGNFNGCPPNSGTRGYKYSWILSDSRDELNYFGKIIKSWSTKPKEVTITIDASKISSLNTTYGSDGDTIITTGYWDVGTTIKKEEPKLINLSDDVPLLNYREEKQTLLKID